MKPVPQRSSLCRFEFGVEFRELGFREISRCVSWFRLGPCAVQLVNRNPLHALPTVIEPERDGGVGAGPGPFALVATPPEKFFARMLLGVRGTPEIGLTNPLTTLEIGAMAQFLITESAPGGPSPDRSPGPAM